MSGCHEEILCDTRCPFSKSPRSTVTPPLLKTAQRACSEQEKAYHASYYCSLLQNNMYKNLHHERNPKMAIGPHTHTQRKHHHISPSQHRSPIGLVPLLSTFWIWIFGTNRFFRLYAGRQLSDRCIDCPSVEQRHSTPPTPSLLYL